ncbi:MAG: selenite/tellurite reduction operon b-type cytochrome iron-sulfur cluster-binding subunit ExtO [Gemmatimonadota bacterium]
MRSTTLFIAVFLLAASAVPREAGAACGTCHPVSVRGAHAGIPCARCHVLDGKTVRDPAAAAVRARGCVSCHAGADRIFDGPMSVRAAEKAFAARTVGRLDPEFFGTACGSCHVAGCLDCHGGGGHAVARPGMNGCIGCHSGYFVGADYLGLAPREESMRYARGPSVAGEFYLKMLPDVHAEAGMGCGDCHSMRSLAAGKRASRTCTDCHTPDPGVVEHRIGAHRARMECFACHSAWASQEYGTFYIRTGGRRIAGFDLRHATPEYARSAYLKKQDAPPLGINGRGRISPIRPQFILYYSDARAGADPREENRLLAASWKAFFPHTVRRGTVLCGGCHDDPRRLVLERKQDRIYGLREDGMGLASFWDRTGQSVANGRFLDRARAARMSAPSRAYVKAFVEKWKTLTDRVGRSSGP